MKQETQNNEQNTTAKALSEQMKGRTSVAEKEGCCSTDQEHDHGNENITSVQTITKEQLLEKINSNSDVQIVNVLSPEHYGKGFIKGSIRIPLEELDGRLIELDKRKEVVTYCASYECPASKKAAEKLAAKGFKVKAYEGGIKEWSEAGLPIEK